MALGRRVLAVAGICFGLGVLYNSCHADDISLEQKITSYTQKVETNIQRPISVSQVDSYLSSPNRDQGLEAEAQNQLSRLAYLQDILESDDQNLLQDERLKQDYVRAAFELYEYCQNAEQNQALLSNEELLDKFRELLYRIPTYAWTLKHTITFPEEKEYFSFNRETELDSEDVKVFCKESKCPNLNIESVLHQVCGDAMDYIARKGKYSGQQMVEDFIFAQLLISANEQEFKQLLTNRILFDPKDIVETLHGRVEDYMDLTERLDSLLPKVEEPTETPYEIIVEQPPEEQTEMPPLEQTESETTPEQPAENQETSESTADEQEEPVVYIPRMMPSF